MRNPSFETNCEKKVAKSGLGPYFPLISGIFVFRSGLGFSFQALEVSVPRVRKRPFSLTKTKICIQKLSGLNGQNHKIIVSLITK